MRFVLFESVIYTHRFIDSGNSSVKSLFFFRVWYI